MTQEELTQKVGVTYQSVSKWKLGISCHDITLLQGLAKIFDISIDELI